MPLQIAFAIARKGTQITLEGFFVMVGVFVFVFLWGLYGMDQSKMPH